MSEGGYGVQAPGRVTHGLVRLSAAMCSRASEWAERTKLTPTGPRAVDEFDARQKRDGVIDKLGCRSLRLVPKQ